jgi:hypothetical protein
MTSYPLGNVFEAMMEKGQEQIPDEGFLMTKMPMYFRNHTTWFVCLMEFNATFNNISAL